MTKLHNMARALVLAALTWSGAASADVVTDWNQIIMASAGPGRPGPIAFHDVAVAHLAMHDAIQSYEGRFEPYYVQVSDPQGSKAAAAATAAYRLLVTFYPSQAATLDATYGTWLANNGLTGDAGIEAGEAVAARYVGIRRSDPNPPLPPFTGGTNPGEWRPTAPAFAPMAFEQQAYFIPFALTGPARFRAPPPPALTSRKYTADYNEVKEKGALTGSTRTAAETDIANFWLDNPGNIWFGGLRAIVEERVPNTGNRARLFALASMSVASAITTCLGQQALLQPLAPDHCDPGRGQRHERRDGRRSGLAAVHHHAALFRLHVGCQQRERGNHEVARVVLPPGRHPVHAHEHCARRHQEGAEVRELHGGIPRGRQRARPSGNSFPLRGRRGAQGCARGRVTRIPQLPAAALTSPSAMTMAPHRKMRGLFFSAAIMGG